MEREEGGGNLHLQGSGESCTVMIAFISTRRSFPYPTTVVPLHGLPPGSLLRQLRVLRRVLSAARARAAAPCRLHEHDPHAGGVGIILFIVTPLTDLEPFSPTTMLSPSNTHPFSPSILDSCYSDTWQTSLSTVRPSVAPTLAACSTRTSTDFLKLMVDRWWRRRKKNSLACPRRHAIHMLLLSPQPR